MGLYVNCFVFCFFCFFFVENFNLDEYFEISLYLEVCWMHYFIGRSRDVLRNLVIEKPNIYFLTSCTSISATTKSIFDCLQLQSNLELTRIKSDTEVLSVIYVQHKIYFVPWFFEQRKRIFNRYKWIYNVNQRKWACMLGHHNPRKHPNKDRRWLVVMDSSIRRNKQDDRKFSFKIQDLLLLIIVWLSVVILTSQLLQIKEYLDSNGVH